MTFKLTIAQTKPDGTKNKIELENSQPLQNQRDFLNLLMPLLRDPGSIEAEPVHFNPEAVKSLLNGSVQTVQLTADRVTVPAEKEKMTTTSGITGTELVGTSSSTSTFSVGEILKGKLQGADVQSDDGEQKEPNLNRVVEGKGIAQLHCPKCGLMTSRRATLHTRYYECPTCNTKLYLYPINDHEPDARGITYRANNVYKTAKEKFEEKYGKTE